MNKENKILDFMHGYHFGSEPYTNLKDHSIVITDELIADVKRIDSIFDNLSKDIELTQEQFNSIDMDSLSEMDKIKCLLILSNEFEFDDDVINILGDEYDEEITFLIKMNKIFWRI